MKFPRRRFLQLAASAPALSAFGRVATAQSYPSRPVLLLVGYGPGGVNDIVARLTGQMVADDLANNSLSKIDLVLAATSPLKRSCGQIPMAIPCLKPPHRVHGTQRSIQTSSSTSSATSHRLRAQ